MNQRLLLLWLVGFIAGVSRAGLAQTIDPTPNLTTINRPVEITAAIQQADGKHVMVGRFSTVEGRASGGVARYNADHTPDVAFNANVASLRGIGTVENVRQLASGKLLLIGPDSIRIGNVGRRNLLRLNTDGTPDATFNAGSGTTYVATGRIPNPRLITAVQPDGKILVGGDFQTFSGATVNRLTRLLPDGALDPSFNLAAPLNGMVKKVVLQPDGKILVAGYFTTPRRVLRVLPDGSVDNTFTSPLGNSTITFSGLEQLGLQPDGKIIISGRAIIINGRARDFARLMPNGSFDATFAPPDPADYANGAYNPYDASTVAVLADGRIVLSGAKKAFLYNNTSQAHGLICLTANGAVSNTLNDILLPDTRSGWNTGSEHIYSLFLQPNGQWLIAGNSKLLAGQRAYVALLNADGTHDATFNPNLLGTGYLTSVAQQADGRLVVGGDFDELNGVRARHVARLNLDGSVDAAFSNQNNLRYETSQVALTPAGKILVASDYGTGLEQLLTTGVPDPGFRSGVRTAGSTGVSKLLLQPDGRIIVLTQLLSVQRLFSNGQFDNSFSRYEESGIRSIALQTDGKVIVGGNLEHDAQTGLPTRNVIRLLPDGQRDPSFVELAGTSNMFINAVTLQSTDKIVVSASSARNGTSKLLRLQPNGQPDASFTPVLARFTNDGYSVVQVQSDDRLVVADYEASSFGSAIRRVLADGQPDNTFNPIACDGYNYALLPQTDGKIVSVGIYEHLNSTSRLCLARIVPGNALATHQAAAGRQLAAWPNPARDVLSVTTDRAANKLTLLSLQGQVVAEKPAAAVTTTLDVRQLPAGVYLLRVDYAQGGPVTRRVVVQ